MVADTDYSLYWKVDQDAQTFTAPTRVSYATLSGRVMGNGKSLGLTDGTNTASISQVSGNGGSHLTPKYAIQDVGGSATTTELSNNKAYGVSTDPANSGIIAEQSTSQLYFKVSNAVQNLQVINVGEITTALADKIGRTECKSYVTETYTNGNSWYRIYSDGWCEQGGLVYIQQTSGFTINLIKSYTNSQYNIYCSSPTLPQAYSGAGDVYIIRENMTNSSFIVRANAQSGLYWMTTGYVSQGE